MSDNATAHKADEYESEVARTIPFHAEILETAIDVTLAARTSERSGEVRGTGSSRGEAPRTRTAPVRWLDTGCGPGKLVELARTRAPETEFWLADPSEAMLAIARSRIENAHFLSCGSADLPDGEPFDAITAVQCHHYGDEAARMRAVARCRDRLAPGGTLVVFENVRAETDEGHAIQRKRWAEFQRRQGRDEATIEKHLAREGKAFFPIRVSEHLALFARLGFRTVEIVWRAYGQAGFFCQRN